MVRPIHPLEFDRLRGDPTQKRIRRAKVKLRAKHLAKLKPQHGKRPPNIREYPATIFGPNPTD